MAIIKLENIAATASITIQLIKDFSMYTSEIISSNGTIFQSTDTSTTLSFRAYKGIENVTDKIIDIDWHRYYFRNDELVEDIGWGDDKKNKNRIVLYKDEIEEKSIIQANGYAFIEDKRELVTTARITMIKISDVYVSDIEPTEPSDKMMWMDMNNNPPILKIWSETLNTWISSGTDIPIVKNHIKNSNFWTNIDDYYTTVNSSYIETPTIVSYQNKYWANLRSQNRDSQGGGIEQIIQYPIIENSTYTFSFIGYRDTNFSYNGTNIVIRINGTTAQGNTISLVNETKSLSDSISTNTISFKVHKGITQLSVYLGTQDRAYCSFYVTELSLYNSAVYYPWELCPDDIDKQMINKLDNDRTSVFNTLTDDGSFRAIYESENQYYIRSEYIVPAVANKTDYDDLVTKYNTLLSNYNTLIQTVDSLLARVQALENNNSGGDDTWPPTTE